MEQICRILYVYSGHLIKTINLGFLVLFDKLEKPKKKPKKKELGMQSRNEIRSALNVVIMIKTYQNTVF